MTAVFTVYCNSLGHESMNYSYFRVVLLLLWIPKTIIQSGTMHMKEVLEPKKRSYAGIGNYLWDGKVTVDRIVSTFNLFI